MIRGSSTPDVLQTSLSIYEFESALWRIKKDTFRL
jgi:hypothetical protein